MLIAYLLCWVCSVTSCNATLFVKDNSDIFAMFAVYKNQYYFFLLSVACFFLSKLFLRGKVNVVRSLCNLNALIWGKNPNVIFLAIINTQEAVEEIIWLQDIFINFFIFNVYKPTRNYTCNCIFKLIKKSQCTHY